MPHRAFGIYVHITWHTRYRQRLIRRAEVDTVRAAIHEAAVRWQVHVHEVAILSDHVHVIASFRPEGGVVSFIRHAKCRPTAPEASGPRAALSAADPGPAARGLPVMSGTRGRSGMPETGVSR